MESVKLAVVTCQYLGKMTSPNHTSSAVDGPAAPAPQSSMQWSYLRVPYVISVSDGSMCERLTRIIGWHWYMVSMLTKAVLVCACSLQDECVPSASPWTVHVVMVCVSHILYCSSRFACNSISSFGAYVLCW